MHAKKHYFTNILLRYSCYRRCISFHCRCLWYCRKQ